MSASSCKKVSQDILYVPEPVLKTLDIIEKMVLDDMVRRGQAVVIEG